MPKITTLLFDCDNTLVLSESLAFSACANLVNQILSSKGIPDRYTGSQLFFEFVGQNFRGMITSLCQKYSLDLSPSELEKYISAEEDEVIAKLEESLQPCEGVDTVLEKLEREQKYTMAVVSSSALRRVKASVVKVGQDKYFGERMYSAATSLETPTSKPDPAIYLHAMKVLGVEAPECIAIEDSKSGATSAVRAGIKTIGYTGSCEEEEEVEKMNSVLRNVGCVIVMKNWRDFDNYLEKIEKGEL